MTLSRYGFLAVLAAGLLAGCGDDDLPYRPTAASPPTASRQGPFPPAPQLPSKKPATARTSYPDYLGGGAAKDALAGPGGSGLASSVDLAGGPKMPTQHSHWLRGTVSNAAVTVSLNDRFLDQFRSGMDKDITMRLRKGINSVTFVFEPHGPGASTHLEIIEGEHNPPAPPLVTYNRFPSEGTATPKVGAAEDDPGGAEDVETESPATAARETETFYFKAQ